jgi:hypothetical protein
MIGQPDGRAKVVVREPGVMDDPVPRLMDCIDVVSKEVGPSVETPLDRVTCDGWNP